MSKHNLHNSTRILKKLSCQVYSCAMESKYLLDTNIPSLNLDSSLVKLFATYGTIEEHRPLHEYPTEQFCDVYLIKFFKIQNARCAKIKLDNYGFFGAILHVCYAPEYESLDDLRDKINERNFIVSVKCKKYGMNRIMCSSITNERFKFFFETN